MSNSTEKNQLSDEMLSALNRLRMQSGNRKDGMILVNYNAVLVWINRVQNLEHRLNTYRKDHGSGT